MKTAASVTGLIVGYITGYRMTKSMALAFVSGIIGAMLVYDLFLYTVE